MWNKDLLYSTLTVYNICMKCLWGHWSETFNILNVCFRSSLTDFFCWLYWCIPTDESPKPAQSWLKLFLWLFYLPSESLCISVKPVLLMSTTVTQGLFLDICPQSSICPWWRNVYLPSYYYQQSTVECLLLSTILFWASFSEISR